MPQPARPDTAGRQQRSAHLIRNACTVRTCAGSTTDIQHTTRPPQTPPVALPPVSGASRPPTREGGGSRPPTRERGSRPPTRGSNAALVMPPLRAGMAPAESAMPDPPAADGLRVKQQIRVGGKYHKRRPMSPNALAPLAPVGTPPESKPPRSHRRSRESSPSASLDSRPTTASSLSRKTLGQPTLGQPTLGQLQQRHKAFWQLVATCVADTEKLLSPLAGWQHVDAVNNSCTPGNLLASLISAMGLTGVLPIERPSRGATVHRGGPMRIGFGDLGSRCCQQILSNLQDGVSVIRAALSCCTFAEAADSTVWQRISRSLLATYRLGLAGRSHSVYSCAPAAEVDAEQAKQVSLQLDLLRNVSAALLRMQSTRKQHQIVQSNANKQMKNAQQLWSEKTACPWPFNGVDVQPHSLPTRSSLPKSWPWPLAQSSSVDVLSLPASWLQLASCITNSFDDSIGLYQCINRSETVGGLCQQASVALDQPAHSTRGIDVEPGSLLTVGMAVLSFVISQQCGRNRLEIETSLQQAQQRLQTSLHRFIS